MVACSFRAKRAGAGSAEATLGVGGDDSDGVSPERSSRCPSILAGDRLGETMPKMSARMVEDDVQAIMGFPKAH